jgi:hypothetical protein
MTPTPSDPGTCPICRAHLIEGSPGIATELVPMVRDDETRYYSRLMSETPTR